MPQSNYQGYQVPLTPGAGIAYAFSDTLGLLGKNRLENERLEAEDLRRKDFARFQADLAEEAAVKQHGRSKELLDIGEGYAARGRAETAEYNLKAQRLAAQDAAEKEERRLRNERILMGERAGIERSLLSERLAAEERSAEARKRFELSPEIQDMVIANAKKVKEAELDLAAEALKKTEKAKLDSQIENIMSIYQMKFGKPTSPEESESLQKLVGSTLLSGIIKEDRISKENIITLYKDSNKAVQDRVAINPEIVTQELAALTEERRKKGLPKPTESDAYASLAMKEFLPMYSMLTQDTTPDGYGVPKTGKKVATPEDIDRELTSGKISVDDKRLDAYRNNPAFAPVFNKHKQAEVTSSTNESTDTSNKYYEDLYQKNLREKERKRKEKERQGLLQTSTTETRVPQSGILMR